MKNFWSILFFVAILQSLTLSILAGHHGQGSNIAHILAAGLIVQLLSRSGGHHGHHHHHHGHHGHHGHHHHGHGRHSGGNVHSEYSPYAQGNWAEEPRMAPESTLASSAWAQRAPMDINYAQSQFKDPIVESYSHSNSYSMPYYYPQTATSDLW